MSNIPDLPFDLWMAEQIIEDTYGFAVSVVKKKKTLLKFGERDDLGSSKTTLARLGSGELDETYVSTNTITHFASSSASDTGDMSVEYHTIDDDGNFSFGVQTVILAGQSKTALTVPCARTSRIFNLTDTAWVGDIYVAEDVTFTNGVPQTASAIHIVASIGDNQSFKCSTTISNRDYWIIGQMACSVEKKQSASVDFELHIRAKDKLFLPVFHIGVSTSGTDSLVLPISPPIIVPSNADVHVEAIASTTGVEASAWLNGYLAVRLDI